MKPKTTFVFKTERTIRNEHLEITKWQSADLRRKLPKGIYWLQASGSGGLVHWNVPLLVDWVVNGDRQEHQDLISAYLAQLPTAA
jgi:hypothetical protein